MYIGQYNGFGQAPATTAAPVPAPEPSTVEKIIAAAAKAAETYVTAKLAPKVTPPVPPPAQLTPIVVREEVTPGWVLPVVLGAGGLIVVGTAAYFITRKR